MPMRTAPQCPAPRLRPPEKAPGDLREGLPVVQAPTAPTCPAHPVYSHRECLSPCRTTLLRRPPEPFSGRHAVCNDLAPEMPVYAVISSASSIRHAGLFPPPSHKRSLRQGTVTFPSPCLALRFRSLPPPGAPCLLPPGRDRRLLRRHLTRPPAYFFFDAPGMTSLRSVCLCWAVPVSCLFYRCAQNRRAFYSLLICDLLHYVSQDTNSPLSSFSLSMTLLIH